MRQSYQIPREGDGADGTRIDAGFFTTVLCCTWERTLLAIPLSAWSPQSRNEYTSVTGNDASLARFLAPLPRRYGR